MADLIKVGYDAGHGRHTAGKRTPDGEREWEFNNKVAKAFAKELSFYVGVASKRFDDSTGEWDVSLNARTNGANAWGADYYISFHHNANTGVWGNWTGIETFHAKGSVKGLALAKAIHPAVVATYGLADRGLKDNSLHITRETKMPAILIEGGFMDSRIDIKKLRDDRVLETAGKNVAIALAKFLGLKRIDEPKGGLTVSQYEELKNLITTQAKRIEELEAEVKKRALLSAPGLVHVDFKDDWDWARENGLTIGTNPRGALTRQQAMTILRNYHNNVK